MPDLPSAILPLMFVGGLILAGWLHVRANQTRGNARNLLQHQHQVESLEKQLADQRREIENLKAQLAERQTVIQDQRDSTLKLLADKDALIQQKENAIRQLQENLDDRDHRIALRKQGDALVGEGNLLMGKVVNARHDEVPNLWPEVINWVRRVYNFADQPPLVCASDVVVGLGLELSIRGQPSDALRTFEATMAAMDPEAYRKFLQRIIDQVCDRFLACLKRVAQ